MLPFLRQTEILNHPASVLQVLGLQTSSLLPSLLSSFNTVKSEDRNQITHFPSIDRHCSHSHVMILSYVSPILGRRLPMCPRFIWEMVQESAPGVSSMLVIVSQNLLQKFYQASALLTTPQALKVSLNFWNTRKKSNALDWHSQPVHSPRFSFIRNLTQKYPWFIFDQRR